VSHALVAKVNVLLCFLWGTRWDWRNNWASRCSTI